MSQLTNQDNDEAVVLSDESSSCSEEGWGFLLGGLSTDAMASANWVTNEDESSNKMKDADKNGTAKIDKANRKNDTAKKRTVDDDGQDDLQQQQQTLSQRAFCVSPNGKILRPPVRIKDCSSKTKGNILVATKCIPKGSVIFTEKALVGIQVPSSSPAIGDLYTVRACQNCFQSLEPASCLSSGGLPLLELWPVPEYDGGGSTSESQECIIAADDDSNEEASLRLHSKSGRVTCPDCGAIFCNRYCAKHHLNTIGDCCGYTKAIEGLVNVVVSSEKARLSHISGDNDNDEGNICESLIEINPTLILAARMFIAQVRSHCRNESSGDPFDHPATDSLFHGLCGDADDVRALGFEPCSILSNDEDTGEPNNPLPLQREYEAVANAIGLTESELKSDWRFSLRQFQKLVAIAQRNSISLMTGSPFRTYYQAMIRKTGGRGSERQQKVVSDMARLLGSKTGKLTRDMDRLVENKCVVEMGGIFTLTARMNHSCDPNAEIRGQEYVDCNIDVVAKQEIEKGEEICISYINLGSNPSYSASARNRRQRQLTSRYLFHCQCSRCVE